MQQSKSIMQIIRIQELNRQIIIYAMEWCGVVNGGGCDGGGGGGDDGGDCAMADDLLK